MARAPPPATVTSNDPEHARVLEKEQYAPAPTPAALHAIPMCLVVSLTDYHYFHLKLNFQRFIPCGRNGPNVIPVVVVANSWRYGNVEVDGMDQQPLVNVLANQKSGKIATLMIVVWTLTSSNRAVK